TPTPFRHPVPSCSSCPPFVFTADRMDRMEQDGSLGMTLRGTLPYSPLPQAGEGQARSAATSQGEGLSRPRRPRLQHPRVRRAALAVRAGEVAGAQEELPHDLPAGEDEGLPEELPPRLLRERVVGVQPGGEGAALLPQAQDAARVLDGGVHLEAVP